MTRANVKAQGTAPRQEYRFLLDRRNARTASEVVLQHCRVADEDYFTPWNITVYLDTADLAIYNQAEQGGALSLRLREYHADRPVDVLTSSTVWVEFKEISKSSRKDRMCLAAEDIVALLTARQLTPNVLRRLPAQAVEWIDAGVRPVLVTRCRRRAYQAIGDPLRVTIDQELTYLSAKWADDKDLPGRIAVGPMIAKEHAVLMELKSSEALPDWASDLVASLQEQTDDRPSKFVVGMRHLLRAPDTQALRAAS